MLLAPIFRRTFSHRHTERRNHRHAVGLAGLPALPPYLFIFERLASVRRDLPETEAVGHPEHIPADGGGDNGDGGVFPLIKGF